MLGVKRFWLLKLGAVGFEGCVEEASDCYF